MGSHSLLLQNAKAQKSLNACRRSRGKSEGRGEGPFFARARSRPTGFRLSGDAKAEMGHMRQQRSALRTLALPWGHPCPHPQCKGQDIWGKTWRSRGAPILGRPTGGRSGDRRRGGASQRAPHQLPLLPRPPQEAQLEANQVRPFQPTPPAPVSLGR